MKFYLTENEEDTIYQQVMNIFETQKGECTNCETNYIFDERNYFDMMTEENSFTVTFKTNNGKLLKRSLTIKKL